jgi:hypothetical protein
MGTIVSRPELSAAFRTRPFQHPTRVVWFLALCAALVLSRWVLAPRYLITFDEINFALAIDHFNPALHQPQPPGDPIFVGLLKLLSLSGLRVEIVFLLAGFVMSVAALALVWRLCELIAGRGHGVTGALLLLFNPAFWLSALTNPVRLSYAAGASLVACCVWLACRRNCALWLPLAAAALGFATGFRPSIVELLAPLIIWAGWTTRAPWKTVALSLVCFAAAVLTWLPFLLISVGGWRQYVSLLRGYSNAQFSGSSLLFGAPLGDALKMAWEAVVWSCLGALSWVWAVPLAARNSGRSAVSPSSRFLIAWFVPGLLFYATVHVGDADHTLAIVPATCVAGALVLEALTRRASRTRIVLAVSTAVLLNVLLFLKPISKTAKASTYAPVRWMNGYISEVIGGIRNLPGPRPVTVVFSESTTGWRQLSYYEPEVHIVVVMDGPGGPVTTRHIVGSRVNMQAITNGTVALPSCGTLAWIDPQMRPRPDRSGPMASFHSRIFFTPAAPRESFRFHGLRFVSGAETCESEMPVSAASRPTPSYYGFR